MFSSLIPVIYVQVSPERLTLKNIKSGESIDEVPEVAISKTSKPVILAIGSQARMASASTTAKIVNPFAHPRSMVSDFTVAEHLLKHLVRCILGKSLFTIAPCIIIHPLGDPVGGFTQVERRAFREMALSAGASKVHVWTGRPLTDEEVLFRRPPLEHGEWE